MATKKTKTDAQLKREIAAALASGDDRICSCPGDDGKQPTARTTRATVKPAAMGHDLRQPQISAHGKADSAEMLAAVKNAVRQIPPSGRFGPNKVFVSEVWRVVSRDPRIGAYTIDQFKNWLVAAQRDNELLLARADLVGAMDPRLVRESEINSLGATFHFVIDPSKPHY